MRVSVALIKSHKWVHVHWMACKMSSPESQTRTFQYNIAAIIPFISSMVDKSAIKHEQQLHGIFVPLLFQQTTTATAIELLVTDVRVFFSVCKLSGRRRRMSSGKVKSRHLITTIINYYYRHVRHLICINYNNGLWTRLIKFVLLITIKVSSSIDKSRVHHHQPWPCYRRRGWHGDWDKGDIRTNDCLVASCHWMASLSAILLRVFVLDGTKPQK